MDISTPEQITSLLARLGERCSVPAEIYLFGGSALLLMGGRRNTADVDYTLSPPAAETLREIIAGAAAEFDLDLEEAIPAQFMPLPAGSERRHQLIGHYGLLSAYIFDPYSIAVMKTDRAFQTDIEDVRFLLRGGHIQLDFLEACIEDVAARYEEPLQLRRNFEEMRRGL